MFVPPKHVDQSTKKGPLAYKYMWGDKDTYELAFNFTKVPYYQNKYNVNIPVRQEDDGNISLIAFLQPNPENGKSLFLHRVGGNKSGDIEKYTDISKVFNLVGCNFTLNCPDDLACSSLL